MIKDRVTSKGFRVIDLTLPEIQKLGAVAPICDNCNTPLLEGGVYIGVLANRTYCKTCFENWHHGAVFYPEDKDYEDLVTDRTLKMLR